MIVHEGDIYCRLHDIIAVAENDEQIKDTFKDEEKEEEQPTAPPPATTRKRGGRPPKWDKPAAEKKPKAGRAERKCSKCGEPGHQARTCGATYEPAGRESDEEASPAFRKGGISEEQYDRVKGMQADGENSMAISRDTGIPLVQVGRILNSDDYEEYLAK